MNVTAMPFGRRWMYVMMGARSATFVLWPVRKPADGARNRVDGSMSQEDTESTMLTAG
jgi:hypothetical protein